MLNPKKPLAPWFCCCGARRLVQAHAREEGPPGQAGSIRQAWQAALQGELAGLYALMAQLDALAGHPLPSGALMHKSKPLASSLCTRSWRSWTRWRGTRCRQVHAPKSKPLATSL
jgi:hypothetical protein